MAEVEVSIRFPILITDWTGSAGQDEDHVYFRDAQQLVGPERRERVSHQTWRGEGCVKSRCARDSDGTTRNRDGTWGSLDLFRASSVPIRRHVKIRAEARN